MERFLQLAAQNNIQVANLTTPSQIFHALRRQVRREFRKPLVIMTPKSLLRHPRATNSIEEIATGTFKEVINDPFISDAKKVEKIVFVSGKLYYELLDEREKTKDLTTALVRLEQIYPFPALQVKEIFTQYSNAKKFVWTQEEPKNMGAYQFVFFRFMELLNSMGLKLSFSYVGRGERASPATGSIYRHRNEQQQIITDVFKV
jgi:2-oxoglutarate dehydrogenase E1 component